MSHPCVAESQDKEWFKRADWLSRHEQYLDRTRSLKDTQVVFLGDSITEAWLGDGKAAWDEYFPAYKPLNLGIGGDETQHVLWRIANGELDGINPKALVLLIGTNNIGNAGHCGFDTAKGVGAVVAAIKDKLPNTKILLLAVFPRDPKPGTAFRKEIDVLNAIICKLADGTTVHYLDLAALFLQPDGTLPSELFPDSLHLSAKAYDLFGNAVVKELQQIIP